MFKYGHGATHQFAVKPSGALAACLANLRAGSTGERDRLCKTVMKLPTKIKLCDTMKGNPALHNVIFIL